VTSRGTPSYHLWINVQGPAGNAMSLQHDRVVRGVPPATDEKRATATPSDSRQDHTLQKDAVRRPRDLLLRQPTTEPVPDSPGYDAAGQPACG
jgi:hypothetical protein